MISFIDVSNDIIDIFSRVNSLFDVSPKCFILQKLFLVEPLQSLLLVLIEQKKENQANHNEDISILAHRKSPCMVEVVVNKSI